MVVPEENVLRLPHDPFAGKSMVVSVFAKGLYQVTGMRAVDPDFEQAAASSNTSSGCGNAVKRLDVEFDHKLQKALRRSDGERSSGRARPRRGTASNTGRPASKPTSTPPATANRRN